jgi:hypothetical protein
VAGFIPARALFIRAGVRFIAAQKRAEYRTDRIIFTWVMDRNKTIKKLVSRDSSRAKKSKIRRPWSLVLINFLLILLLVYLGRQTLQHVRNAGLEPKAPATATTASADTSLEAKAAMFFQTLKEGGDIAVKIKRRRRTIQINLKRE